MNPTGKRARREHGLNRYGCHHVSNAFRRQLYDHAAPM